MCWPVHAQSLPAPWSAIPDLTPEQTEGIAAVIAEFDVRLQARRAEIVSSVENRGTKTRSSLPDSVEIVLRTRNLDIPYRYEMRREIERLLTPAQISRVNEMWTNTLRTAAAVDFDNVKAQQQTALWCWAAIIQMIFAYSGIDISQSEIVADIKGTVVVDRASIQEIERGVTEAHFNPAQVSPDWSTQCRYWEGVPPDGIIVNTLNKSRIMVIALEQQHLAVLHVANYLENTEGSQITVQNVKVYDPATGEDASWTRAQLSEYASGYWDCWVGLRSLSAD